MYEIYFYRDEDGKAPVADFMRDLERRTDKASRVTLKQVRQYLDYLSALGTRAGPKIVKYLGGEIWELRPAQNRILFAAWYRGSFLLLHTFVKKTQKTPQKEMDRAKRELADMKRRFPE